jgi:hypothetical protein
VSEELEQVRRLLRIDRAVDEASTNERMPYGVQPSADDNVSNPPTNAELDTAFGTPAAVGDGFVGVLDDAGGSASVWLCVSDGTEWWYEGLTKAV